MENAILEVELVRRRRVQRSLALGVVDSIESYTPHTKSPRKKGPHYGWVFTLMILVLTLALLSLAVAMKHA